MRNHTKPKDEIKKSAKTAVKPSSSLFSDISSVSSVYQEGQLDLSDWDFSQACCFLNWCPSKFQYTSMMTRKIAYWPLLIECQLLTLCPPNPSSSQNSCGSSPCLRRSTVPLDLSMLSAARTCSELETERTFPESWNQQTAACTRTPGDKASASFYFILLAVIKSI